MRMLRAHEVEIDNEDAWYLCGLTSSHCDKVHDCPVGSLCTALAYCMDMGSYFCEIGSNCCEWSQCGCEFCTEGKLELS
jgi:hypothetical protein